MPVDLPALTRKQFLFALAAPAVLYESPALGAPSGKLLIVVAHPDDEYAFAASVYRLVREHGWTADQVIVTNGEAGYRYSSLAESFYGMSLANERDGRARLPGIRKEEAIRAGRILGIRRHHFLDQQDSGFATDAALAPSLNWDRAYVLAFLNDLLARERYDVILTLLPTAQTHGHHRAATELALEAASRIPETERPLILGAEPRSRHEPPLRFSGRPGTPVTATVSADAGLTFDRATPLGYHDALNYGIVANWVVAEHKSQGLFQLDSGRHDLEEFWLFAASGPAAGQRLADLQAQLPVPGHAHTAAR